MTAARLPQNRYDLVIIGAGPAGLAAAALAGKAGLSTLVLDENNQPGGQIFRAVTSTPVKRRDVLGDDYWCGERLVTEARAGGATIIQGATVWSLDRDLQIAVSVLGQSQIITARHVILATGAQERPFPIPGWTLPGVMTVGAGQTILKSSGLVPDGKAVIAGTGPLLWLYAAQVLRAGGKIEVILDTTPYGNYWRAIPYALPFVFSPYRAKGLALMREVKRKVAVVSNIVSLAALGNGNLNEVAYRRMAGAERRIAADTLLLHQGVVPNVNLAMAAGVEHRWNDKQLCWLPELDADGNTSVKGIAIAGDGAGIGGALAATERGRIAALAAVAALTPDRLNHLPTRSNMAAALQQAERGRTFLDVLFQPAQQFRRPDGETIVCRCEEVNAAQIKETIGLGVEGPNQLKSFLRCGMGPCQGRLCGLTVTELIAQMRNVSPGAVGYYRLRPPVKPIALKELAAMPKPETAVKAVVRG